MKNKLSWMKTFLAKVAVGAIMLLGALAAQAQNVTQTNAFLPDPAFYPQYAGSGTSTRIPTMFRATITNLAASTTYRYFVQAGTNSDLGSANSGAGNSMLINSAGTTFTYTTGPGLTTAGNYETFTTDASGNYTGWFGFVYSGNARFNAGAILFPVITIGNTSGTTLLRYAPPASSGTILFLAFSTSAGANNGTGIRGTNSSATAKNFVTLHDTAAGTGRPLAVTFVESDGNNLASGATYYGTAGTGPVDGVAGAWGTIIPNTLANGVRRIAQYNNAGTLVGGNTSANGTWTSGVNTVNPAGGTTTVLDIKNNDAPLNIAFTVAYNNNGGAGSQTDASSPYAVGSTVTVLGTGTITRTGFAFSGWNTAANGSGTSYATNNTFTINASTTLFAQWTRVVVTTSTTVSSSANPSTYNQSITFTASVQTNGVTAGNATSNYVFKVDGVAVATNAVSSGSATYTVSTLVSGVRSITAEYAGDANYTASTNSGLTQTVNKATTTVTLSVGNSPVTYSGAGQSATVSITASNTPGSVQSILTGGAATQTASGTYAVTASYVPTDTNYTTLTSVSAGNFIINPAALGITANNTNKIYDGVPFTGGNGVSYSGFVNSETPTVLGGSLSYGGTSQGATNAGSYPIVPTGLTSANYAITYTNGTLTITKATPSFNLVSSANPSGYKDAVTFTANSFAADVTGTVQFITNGVNLGSAITLSGASATSSGTAGMPRGATNVVAAIYSGDINYFSLTNAFIQTVTNHPPIAANASFSRNAGIMSLHIAISNLLASVSDVDGDSIALVSASVTTNGITLVNTSGYLNYFNTNAVNDEFTYIVTDGFGGTNTAKVSLLVNNSFVGGQAQGIALVNNLATLNFAGIPTYGYAVQRSTNLIFWDDVFFTNAPANGAFQFVDDLNPVPPPSVFYRLRYQP